MSKKSFITEGLFTFYIYLSNSNQINPNCMNENLIPLEKPEQIGYEGWSQMFAWMALVHDRYDVPMTILYKDINYSFTLQFVADKVINGLEYMRSQWGENVHLFQFDLLQLKVGLYFKSPEYIRGILPPEWAEKVLNTKL